VKSGEPEILRLQLNKSVMASHCSFLTITSLAPPLRIRVALSIEQKILMRIFEHYSTLTMHRICGSAQ